VLLYLPPRIGAWCWQRKVQHRQRKRRWRSFAELTGGHCTASSDVKAINQRRHRISLKLFSRGCSSGRTSKLSGKKGGVCVLICWRRSKNFLSKARHREETVKRGEGRALVSLDDLLARERTDQEPAHKLSADHIYERRWALTLLEQVLTQLRGEYEAAGKLPLFDRLKELLAKESGQPSQAEIAAEMRMTENAVKQAFHRLRHRYGQLLREEIAHTVAVQDDVEDELRHFIAVLQT